MTLEVAQDDARSSRRRPSSTSAPTSRSRKPPGGEIYGHLDARDPMTGAKKWEVRFPEPPIASVLSTARQSRVRARRPRHHPRLRYAETGNELWNHNDGIGHQGGIDQLLGQRQAIRRHDRRLRRHGDGRLRRDLRRALQEHAEGRRARSIVYSLK